MNELTQSGVERPYVVLSKENVKLQGEEFFLFKQPSEHPTICGAVSLVNALILMEADVSEKAAASIINIIIQKKRPLTDEEKKEFVNDFGFGLEPLISESELESISSWEGFLEVLIRKIRENRVAIFKISTHLSKKDSSTSPVEEEFVVEESRRTHSVVAYIVNDKILFIIDPYSPQSPEIFSLEDENEKKKFLTWFFSAYLQVSCGASSLYEIFEKAGTVFKGKFDKDTVSFGISQAAPKLLKKLNAQVEIHR